MGGRQGPEFFILSSLAEADAQLNSGTTESGTLKTLNFINAFYYYSIGDMTGTTRVIICSFSYCSDPFTTSLDEREQVRRRQVRHHSMYE